MSSKRRKLRGGKEYFGCQAFSGKVKGALHIQCFPFVHAHESLYPNQAILQGPSPIYFAQKDQMVPVHLEIVLAIIKSIFRIDNAMIAVEAVEVV